MKPAAAPSALSSVNMMRGRAREEAGKSTSHTGSDGHEQGREGNVVREKLADGHFGQSEAFQLGREDERK